MIAMSNMPISWTTADAGAREANFRRGELGALLRARRLQLGKGREAVAEAAEVSVDLYARLERGKPIPVSAAALGRIAVAVQLDPDQTRYAQNLARPQAGGTEPHETDRPCDVAQLLDGFRAGPAYVVNARWDLMGWNGLFEAMNPAFAGAARAGSPNLLRAIFVEPFGTTAAARLGANGTSFRSDVPDGNIVDHEHCRLRGVDRRADRDQLRLRGVLVGTRGQLLVGSDR
jgi:transcriptional regulator with XRE-family HTH domain